MAIQAGGVDIKLLSSDSRLYRLGIIHFSSTVEFRACWMLRLWRFIFMYCFICAMYGASTQQRGRCWWGPGRVS